MSKVSTKEPPSVKNSYVEGINAIKSEPKGLWAPEFTEKNTENVMKMAERFTGERWGFLGVLTEMEPILDSRVSKLFADMNDELEKRGCVATAFVIGDAVVLKAQANRHHDMSESKKMQVVHFRTEEEAVEWLKSLNL